MEGLEAEDPDLVEQIRRLMFVFEDILLVNDKGIQAVLKEVDNDELASRSRPRATELKEKIFSNMSERAPLDGQGGHGVHGTGARVSDVEAAQQRIVDIVRRLEESGEMIIAGRGGDVLRQVELDPAVVQRQLADVLALMCRPSSVRVAVHPDDQPLINDVLDKLVNDITNCDHAWLEEDPAITRGGCVVTTQDGRIDATIETQIDRIVHTLLPDAHAGGNDAPSEPDGPADDPDDTPPNDEAPEPPGPRDDEDAT
jgi:hypothetical protein